MSSKINKSFCILPWIHMYFDPIGDVFTCCIRSADARPLGNMNRQTAEEVWNSEEMKNVRRDFLNGTLRPDICSGCYKQEENLGSSHRTHFNNNFKKLIAPRVFETSKDGHQPNIKLAYWDFRFSNVCNFKCRTCGPDYSTSWMADAKKLGWDLSGRINTFDQLEFALSQLEYVEDIYFAGGEPLLMNEHYQILDALIAANKTDIQLRYNSNCSTLKFGKWKVLDLWRQFKNLTISPSIDQVGKKAEYVRKGGSWEVVKNNILEIRSEVPWADIYPNITVSIFNVLDLPEIHQTLMQSKIINENEPNAFNFNMVRTPYWYNVAMLPKSIKQKAIENILRYREKIQIEYGVQIAGFDMVISSLEEDLSQHLPEFRTLTRQLDDIRNENFLDYFPELGELVNGQ